MSSDHDIDVRFHPGDMIAGKFAVESVLGAGGMGVVLAARHIELGQRVAIKYLRSDVAGLRDAVTRFMREARALAGIQSEHVVRILDVARLDDGTPYMVMEHLHGLDLEAMVQSRGALPVGEAADYILQACEAVAEAHARGIIHRDLKPANLFLTHRADGSSLVKVLDFGISKATRATSADGSVTGTSDVLGSPSYMSPEQLTEFKKADLRTDIWALGVILHKLISGRQPFEAPTVTNIIAKILMHSPTRLRTDRPGAPVALESLILRCLDREPARRFQSVAEFASALLPFAPTGARLSVDRITGVLGGIDAFVTTEPAATRRIQGENAQAESTTAIFPKPVAENPGSESGNLNAVSALAIDRALRRLPRLPVGVIGGGALSFVVTLAVLGGLAGRHSRALPAPATATELVAPTELTADVIPSAAPPEDAPGVSANTAPPPTSATASAGARGRKFSAPSSTPRTKLTRGKTQQK